MTFQNNLIWKSLVPKESSHCDFYRKKARKIPIAECPIAKVPIAECPIAEIPIAKCPIAECPIAERPIAKCLIAQVQGSQKNTLYFVTEKSLSGWFRNMWVMIEKTKRNFDSS